MNTLGIILSAGNSSRLYPATFPVTKQLLPVYDKPLFFYPLSTLMLAGIQDYAVIVSPPEKPIWEKMIAQADLEKFINIQLMEQEKPTGIPDAFNIVSKFDQELYESYSRVALILGDNLFHGASLTGQIQNALAQKDAAIFAHKVHDLHRFGVINIAQRPYTIVEKPSIIEDPKNSYAIPGLYLFPHDVFYHAKYLKPSARGETEITDLINHYRNYERLYVEVLHRGVAWFDTGTPEALLNASQYISSVQLNQGFLVGSPHEIALRNGWITKDELLEYCAGKGSGQYIHHLKVLAEEYDD